MSAPEGRVLRSHPAHSLGTDTTVVSDDNQNDNISVHSEEKDHTSYPLSLQQREEQLIAANAAMERELAELRIAALQQQLEDRAAQRDALLLSAVQASASVPLATPVRSMPVSVNRTLFNTHVAPTYKAPLSAAIVAKRQSLANLPPMSSSPVVPPIAVAVPTDPVPLIRERIKHTPPAKFTGEKESQNADVEEWIDEANIYFELSHVPVSEHLNQVRGLFSGYALKWFREKREEVQAVQKEMTWAWLQVQLIEEFGRSTGVAAQQAEWLALRMGIENSDGTKTGGKSTYTVKAYTAHFTRLMRALTQHTVLTNDMLVIDRYLEGIRVGYSALWKEMRGNHAVFSYDTLAEAITGAQVAESALAVGKINPSLSSHTHRFRSPMSVQVNHIQSETDNSTSPYDSPSNDTYKEAPRRQINAFVYKPITEEGRYRLSEAQQRKLYDSRLCYRCYSSHPKLGRCGKKMTTAPNPLK